MLRRPEYYWAVIRKNGKSYLVGPAMTESRIRVEVRKHHPEKIQFLRLPTRDDSKATRMIRQANGNLNPISHNMNKRSFIN